MKRKVAGFVISNTEISNDIYSMWITTDLAADANPGQFVGVFPTKESTLLPRPISICQLNVLPHLHSKPINLVVFKGSYSEDGISYLEGGFTLRCLQRLSLPNLATLPCCWYNNRYTSGSSIPVLSY